MKGISIENRKISDRQIAYLSIYFSFILFSIWIILLDYFKPIFENSWSKDPLAMLNTLYPIFFIFLITTSIFCFIYIIYCKEKTHIINIILLIELSIILLYTPLYLSGWVFSPDPIRNIIASESIEKILNSVFYKDISYESQFFNTEIMSYPGSSLFNYIFIILTNIDKVYYIKFIFPIFVLIAIVLIWYSFVSKLFDNLTAFISSLIAISSFFYYKLHPSPYVVGFILLLLTFHLLTNQSIQSYICLLIVIISMVITHPISPIMFELFLITLVFFRVSMNSYTGLKVKKNKYLILLVFILWIFWSMLITPMGNDLITRFYSIVTLKFISGAEDFQKFTFENSFIYPEVPLLNKLIYFLMLIIAYVYILNFIIKQKHKYKCSVLSTRNFLNSRFIFLYIISHIFLLSAAIIVLWGDYDLLERSLTPFVFIMSIIISYIFIDILSQKKFKIQVLICLILILFVISGPIINYSSSAYNSYPTSEKHGLYWLSNRNLNNVYLYIQTPSYHQLSFFVEPNIDIKLIKDIDKMNKSDLIVFRKTNFYFISMRQEFSFSNNSYINTKLQVENDKQFNKIYSNDNFEINSKKSVQ